MLSRELFPQYGRVVIIDDKLEEIKGLIDLLSKQSIPFVYLENVPYEYAQFKGLGIRIVFLDLVLANATDEKTVKSILYGNLTQLIKEDNGPYIIAVWSTQREHYENQIEDLRAELTYPPEDIIYLDKTPYKEYNEDLKERLEKDFEKAFSDCKLLRFLALWENSINKSAIKATSKYEKLLPKGNKVNPFIDNLARMILSKHVELNDIPNRSKLSSAYEGLNLLLNKEANNGNQLITEIASKTISITADSPTIDQLRANTLLWIGDKYDFNSPKNVYKSNNQISSYLFPEQNLDEDVLMFVEIDITNKCTYLQNKTHITGHQLVRGVLFYKNKYKSKQNEYRLKIGEIMWDNQELMFVICAGEIINKEDKEIDISHAVFSISDEVYSQIRSYLGGLYSKSGKTEF